MTLQQLETLNHFKLTLSTERVRLLLDRALKVNGNKEWESSFAYIVEELYGKEILPVKSFLRWLSEHNMSYGRTNYNRIKMIFLDHILAMEDMEGYLIES